MSKPEVIILGGGVAGLSAAHELAERGYSVTIYEKKKEIGGKAKSLFKSSGTDKKPGSAEGVLQHDIPVEHGFRFFPGFYQHVTDTMQRIPVDNTGKKVIDNLKKCPVGMIARYDKKPLLFPTSFPPLYQAIGFYRQIKSAGLNFYKGEKMLFAKKVWQLMTSSPNRINEEYERTSWKEFMEDDDTRSHDFKSLFVAGLTRTLVAAQAEKMSTKTGGNTFIQLVYDILKPWSYGADRVLNGPTQVAWMDPWSKYLKSLNVKFEQEWTVMNLHLKEGKISGVTVERKEEQKIIGDDHCIFILAMPIEDVEVILNRNTELLNADSAFSHFNELAQCTSWMTGIQFFITEQMDINHGHIIYADSDWAVTSISQLEFWDKQWVSQNIDSRIKHILSVDVSDWKNKSRFSNLRAEDAESKQQIKDEVLQQINQSLKKCNNLAFDEKRNVLTYFLDHSISIAKRKPAEPGEDNTELINEEPLLVNVAGTWDKRPKANTRIPNLFLASDYVQTNTDLATMEGANEAARRAVNGILDFTGYNGAKGKCKIFNLYNPFILLPFQMIDRLRYRMNKSNKYSFRWTAVLIVLLFPYFLGWLLISILNILTALPQIRKQSKIESELKNKNIPNCYSI